MKTALLLIEFQNEWLDGKLQHRMQDKDLFLQSLKNAKLTLDAAREQSIPIIHSGLNFPTDYQVLGNPTIGLRYRILQKKTFTKGSHGARFIKDFSPLSNEFVVEGRVGCSAFAGSNLDSYLRNNQIQQIFIMGYALHVCVESTLRGAHDLGYDVCLINDASAAFNSKQQSHMIEEIVPHFGKAITTQQFLKEQLHAK